MLNIYFAHYEAFGGPLINNLVGTAINSFTHFTNAFLTDVGSLILAYALINVLAMVYVFFKSLDAKQAMSFIIDPDRPYINIVTKGVVLAAVFTVFLKPIPVIQMTPVIGYNESSSTSSINAGDRIVAGWLINDMKTTTKIHFPQSASNLDSDDVLGPGTPLQYESNREMMYVPQIFWLLGLIEDFYYGFPDINLGDVVSGELTVLDDGSRRSFFKYSPTIAAPTLLNCVDTADKQKELLSMESGINARIQLGSLNTTCTTKMEISDTATGNIWYQEAKNSFSSILFGQSTVGEGLSDFFEPIDRFFYYLSASFISELIADRVQIDTPMAIIKASSSRLFPAQPTPSPTPAIPQPLESLWSGMLESAKAKDKKMNKSISANLDAITDDLASSKEQLSALEAKSYLQIAHDTIVNQNAPNTWHKNIIYDPSIFKETEVKNLIQTDTRISLNHPISIERDFYHGGGFSLADGFSQDKVGITTSNSLDANLIAAFKAILASPAISLTISPRPVPKYNLPILDTITDSPASPSFQSFTIDGEMDTETRELAKYQSRFFNLNKYLFTKNLLLQYTKDLEKYTQTLSSFYTEINTKCENNPKKTACITEKFAAHHDNKVQLADFDTRIALAGMYQSSYYSNTLPNTNKLEHQKLGDNTDVAYISIDAITNHAGININRLGTLAKPPPIFNDIIPSDFWTAGVSDSSKLSTINGYFNHEASIFDKSVVSLLNGYSQTTNVANKVKVLNGSDGIDTDQFSNWGSSTNTNDNIKSYFATSLGAAYLLAFPRGIKLDTNGTIEFASALEGTTDPTLSNFSEYTAHHLATLYPESDDANANDTIINLNTFKLLLAQKVQGSTESKMNYIKKFNSIINSLKNNTTENGCDSDSCKIMLNDELQTAILLKYNALGGTALTMDSGIVETISLYVEQVNSNFIDSNTIEAEAKLDTSTTPATSVIFDNKVYHLDENKLIKTSQNTAALGLSGEELTKLKTELLDKLAIANSKSSTADVVLNVSIDEPFNISSDTNLASAWSGIIRFIWDIYSIPLDILRDLQNTALIKVSSSVFHTSSFYQPQFLLGAYITPEASSKELISISKNQTRTYSNRSLPKDFTYSTSKAEISSKLNEYWKEEIPVINMSLDDMWSMTGALIAIFLLFAFSSIVALAYLLFAKILKLVLYIVKPTVLIIFLGIMAGILGFLRATIIAPASFALSFIATDFSRGFKNLSHYPELEHIFTHSILNYKLQFMTAIKQLSVWMYSVSVIFALLWIDNNILASWQQAAMMKAWIGDITGQTMFMITSYLIVALTALVYGLLINESYKYLEQFMKSVTLEDPLISSLIKMMKEQKSLIDKVSNSK